MKTNQTKPNRRSAFGVLLSLLLLLTLPALVQAQFNYTTNNGTITITKYTGPGGAVTIPGTINGLPVTSIGNSAFFGSTVLTNVTIPNSVISIEAYAFAYSESLTGVTIGSNVTTIGGSAFDHCTSLTNVTIPNSVTTIGDWVFAYCASLTSITIPNSVTSIGRLAFFTCLSLTSITIPNSVTSIGDEAFAICTSLTSITIPNSVNSIGNHAFGSCTSLTAIMVDTNNPIYSSVAGVMFNKNQTTLIQYPGGKAGSYTIPDSVTIIGFAAFEECRSLTSVTIGNSVTIIGGEGLLGWGGGGAFAYCTSLTNVSIANSVTIIGDWAFAGCMSLTNVTIPDSVLSIGRGAFDSCTSLTSVLFEGNAPTLGSHVFVGANNATVYYLPGTTGWGATFGGRPTAIWVLPYPVILNNGPSFGVQTNGFAFIISWATNLPVVVEACTNLTNPTWSPVRTNTLTDGWSYFSDPQWTNHPGRFYRLTLPAPGKKWLTVAAVTMTAKTNTTANLQTFFAYMEQAASNGVDLVVFPEIALQQCPAWGPASHIPTAQEMAYVQQTAETVPGQSTSNVVAKAKELNLFVVFGMTEKDGAGLLYNTSVVLGPDGVLGKHRKRYLWGASYGGNEDLIWRPGLVWDVVESPLGKVGLMICIEMAFNPGLVLANQGADLLVTSSAWPASAPALWDSATRDNASQAKCWHVVSNQVGAVGYVNDYGHSRVVDPKGVVVCDTGAVEGLVFWATDILIDARTP